MEVPITGSGYAMAHLRPYHQVQLAPPEQRIERSELEEAHDKSPPISSNDDREKVFIDAAAGRMRVTHKDDTS